MASRPPTTAKARPFSRQRCKASFRSRPKAFHADSATCFAFFATTRRADGEGLDDEDALDADGAGDEDDEEGDEDGDDDDEDEGDEEEDDDEDDDGPAERRPRLPTEDDFFSLEDMERCAKEHALDHLRGGCPASLPPSRARSAGWN